MKSTDLNLKAKGIIVCADDFAVHELASSGIAKLAGMGCISATSVMVLSPRWAQDVALLHDVRGRLDVGLHLDWTSDFAMASGHGLPLGQAMWRSILGGFDRAQASAVIERQLDLFETHWQATPDYVDGHQHVQQFAGIREALVAVLARRYAGQMHRPYLRVSRPPQGSMNLKAQVISRMGANALEKVAFNARLTSAGTLLGVYDFRGDINRFSALMVRWLIEAPAGSIIMCHPALAAEPCDAIGEARAQEFAYLTGAHYPEAMRQAGVTLVRGARGLHH
jgi:predicted glycoside hydrolase/deacetylase ChbG (UPF0249 family)